jgi:hypothetical protein
MGYGVTGMSNTSLYKCKDPSVGEFLAQPRMLEVLFLVSELSLPRILIICACLFHLLLLFFRALPNQRTFDWLIGA